jgi:hypothetical protein
MTYFGTMTAEQIKVRQILGNAENFTDHGTIRFAARRRQMDQQDRIDFEIQDTGT